MSSFVVSCIRIRCLPHSYVPCQVHLLISGV
uniref:Uncharacterized protein n=1 Tax=Arundo donax TaxID=35708 RepID=A0A0A8ZPX7_ARUDO